jgi:DNA-binding transcriptional LysR family regulator
MISEVARENGIRIEPGDPLFALVTMNRMVLDESARTYYDYNQKLITEFNASMTQAETRAASTDGGLRRLGRSRFTGHHHLIDQLPRHRFVVRIKRLLLSDLTPAGTRLVADNDERTLQLGLGRAVYIPLAVVGAIPGVPADWPQHARMLPPMS